MAIAPLIVRVTTVGAATLTRTSAALRAAASSIASAGRSAAAASPALTRLSAALRGIGSSPAMARAVALLRTIGNAAASAARTVLTRVTPAFSRLAAVLRSVASGALRAAIVIGGPLRRALHAASDAATSLARNIAQFAVRWIGIIGALLPFVVVLSNVLVSLLPLVFHLAPAAFAAGAALAVLKLGFEGVGTALEAGLSGDLEEFNKALAKLAPSAQDLVRALVKIAPVWRSLRGEIQQHLFAGIGKEIQGLSNTWFPVLTQHLLKVANLFNAFFVSIAKGLQSPAVVAQFKTIFAGVETFIFGALHAIKALGRAFLDIAEVAAPAFGALGSNIGIAADKFAAWIRKLKDDGTLKKWIDDAKETFGKIKDIIEEIGRVFKAIFKGTDEQGFLDNLKESLKKLADWLESEDGQRVIKFFSDVAKGAANLIVAIGKVAEAFSDAIDWIRKVIPGGVDVESMFNKIAAAAGRMSGIVSSAAGAFAWIGDIAGRIAGLVGAVQHAAGAINAALGSIKTLVNIDIVARYSTQGYARAISPATGTGNYGVPQFRASGGPVMRGQPYVVGDAGRPEIFIPDQNGRVQSRVSSGSSSSAWSGAMSGLDALFVKWLNLQVRNGNLKLA